MEELVKYIDSLRDDFMKKAMFCQDHKFELDQKYYWKLQEVMHDISFELRHGQFENYKLVKLKEDSSKGKNT